MALGLQRLDAISEEFKEHTYANQEQVLEVRVLGGLRCNRISCTGAGRSHAEAAPTDKRGRPPTTGCDPKATWNQPWRQTGNARCRTLPVRRQQTDLIHFANRPGKRCIRVGSLWNVRQSFGSG